MKRFVPNYTCKRVEQTGITCVKTLIDYEKGVKVYEKEINDKSEFADKVNKKITEESPWNVPIIYDLASYSIKKKFETKIVKEENTHVKGVKTRIESYSKMKRKELIKKGLKEEVNERIEEKLLTELENNPVLLFLNINYLYNENTSGLGWIIITEYNEHNNEFIIHDPLYYTRLEHGPKWHRIKNTLKNRFISVNKNYLLKTWRKTKETELIPKGEKEGIKPFTREFLTIKK